MIPSLTRRTSSARTLARDSEVLSVLDQGNVDDSSVAPRAFALIRARYDIREGHHPPPEPVALRMAADPLLLSSLQRFVNIDVAFEIFLKQLRRYLLLSHLPPARMAGALLPLIEALAEQCFNNEYVMTEGEDERMAVRELEQRLPAVAEREADHLLSLVFLLGMYRPLAESDVARAVTAMPLESIDRTFRRGVRRLILEPLEEARRAVSMPSLGVVASTTSVAVREQYERHPYPRWFTLTKPQEHEVDFSTREILVAGSGTGRHPIAVALRNPRARILAIDLSKASLAYAQRMAAVLNVHNVTFVHGDLLQLGQLHRQFDLVECSGVLHHLSDPEAGWAALVEVLARGGVLHVAVYSQVARMHVEALRREIAARGVPPTTEAIRQFRATLLADDRYSALRAYVQNADCFTLSGFRDYLFHASESRYTLAQIADLIARLNLTFVRFDPLSLRSKYFELHPEDTAMVSFEHWRRFEPFYAGSNLMFSFWVRK